VNKKPTVANLRQSNNSNLRQQEDRSPVLLTGGNGLGLWCHAKKEASISMYDNFNSNSKLPPIQNKPPSNKARRSANSQRRTTQENTNIRVNKPKIKRGSTKDVDHKIEGSLVEILEKKVMEYSTELDRAEIEKQKMEFEYNIMKRDLEKVSLELDQFKEDNENLVEKSHQLEQRKR